MPRQKPAGARRLQVDVLRLLLTSPEGQGQEEISQIWRQLGRARCEDCGVCNGEELLDFLAGFPQVFQVKKGRGDPSSLVTATTTLNLCSAHSNKSGSCRGQNCSELHLCTFFLLSAECTFGGRCLFSHDLSTPHNRRLLEQHLLSSLSITELRTLFCLPWVRRNVTVPRVCRYYNKHVGCNKGQKCRCLHLCHSYVLEGCKFGKGCRRNHNIQDGQVTEVLTLYGVRVSGRKLTDILQEVRSYEKVTAHDSDDDDDDGHNFKVVTSQGARSKAKRFGSVPNLFGGSHFSISPSSAMGRDPRDQWPSMDKLPRQPRQRQTSESTYSALKRENSRAASNQQLEEICLYHLTGNCKFGEKCSRQHSKTPYLWRISAWESDGGQEEITWRSLDAEQNEALERYFCQPNIMECSVSDVDGAALKVNFKDFTAKETSPGGHFAQHSYEYTLRRLATPSSVEKTLRPSADRLPPWMASVWLWYWRNADGVWNEFGLESDEPERLTLKSDAIERNYITTPITPLKFDHLILDFTKMRLKNLHLGRKFKVRRRPQPFLRTYEESDSDEDSQTEEEEEDDVVVEDEEEDEDEEEEEDYEEEEAEKEESEEEEEESEEDEEEEGSQVEEDDDLEVNNASSLLENVNLGVESRSAQQLLPNGPTATASAHHGPSEGATASAADASKQYIKLLAPENKSYAEVKNSFCSSLGRACEVLSIHRMITNNLQPSYYRKRDQLSKKARKPCYLYYCPEAHDNIEKMCHKGVNCQVNHGATAGDMTLGKGAYFHVTASMADKGNGRNTERRVFLAKCLVGRSTRGFPDLTTPPFKDAKNRSAGRFDSCVDDTQKPRTYVIFQRCRVLPKYLITYRFR